MLRFIIVLGFLLPYLLYGQNSYYLVFNNDNKDYYTEKKTLKFDSQNEINEFLEKRKSKLIKKGFVLTSIDSLVLKNDTAFVSMYQGEKFKQIHIDYNPEDNYIIKKTPRVSERLLARLPFTPEMVEDVLVNINRYLNSTGYPFSKVQLKLNEITPEHSSAMLFIEKGPLVKISKIHIKGESKVREKFVQSAIAIKEGDVYNVQQLNQIASKIEQVQFLREIRPYEILFTPEGAELFLYIESAPISSINGIVGLQPNPTTGKTSVTGEIRLKLLNIVKSGEQLGIEWRSLRPQTQELNVDFNFPFLFNTPFGIDAKFNLYKLDTTYLQINAHAGVRYYFTGGSYIKAFYEFDNTNLLSGATSLPNSNLSSVRNNSYGLGYFRSHVDYVPNPSKGLIIDVEASAGRRKNTPADMDTTITSTVFKGEFNIEAFLPITPRNVIRLANVTRSYYAPAVFKNEQFRLGGLSLQRGFNEESLYATTFTMFSLEYRFLVDKDSHAFAFFDQTIYEASGSEYVKDTPFGFGVGYSFGTRFGIFSISYALGKQFDNPIKMRDGKIHFGYIAYF